MGVFHTIINSKIAARKKRQVLTRLKQYVTYEQSLTVKNLSGTIIFCQTKEGGDYWYTQSAVIDGNYHWIRRKRNGQ